jgi:hypothetical protein
MMRWCAVLTDGGHLLPQVRGFIRQRLSSVGGAAQSEDGGIIQALSGAGDGAPFLLSTSGTISLHHESGMQYGALTVSLLWD